MALHPDDLRYERDEPARVTPDEIFSIPYGELVKELRHELTRRSDEPTPVYPFVYDWRQPLAAAELELEAFLGEVVARTRLLRHYDKRGYAAAPAVDLVAHSMGGLVVAGMLERAAAAGRRLPVGKVASLGAPFRGSLEAVLKVTTGLAALGDTAQSSSEREVARLTPALYYLLPSFAGALEVAPGLSRTLYDPDLWQPSVVETLAEYVRLHGLQRQDRHQQAADLFRGILRDARAHRERLERFRLAAAGLADDAWLCIVGTGEQTRVRLAIESQRGKPRFHLAGKDRVNGWNEGTPDRRVLTGDGTVPYLGARCAFVPVEKLVCVTPRHLGYWEIGDRLLQPFAGFHAVLPKLNLVHRLVAAHLSGRAGGDLRARPAPDLPAGARWDPPVRGLRDDE